MSDTGAPREDARPLLVYEYVGGDPFFVALVEHFYEGVERDAVMRPMYPVDLTGSKARLAGFLIQYWGGPQTYSEQRGHPRLRMRHNRSSSVVSPHGGRARCDERRRCGAPSVPRVLRTRGRGDDKRRTLVGTQP